MRTLTPDVHKLAQKFRSRVLDFAQSHPTSGVFELDPPCSHAGDRRWNTYRRRINYGGTNFATLLAITICIYIHIYICIYTYISIYLSIYLSIYIYTYIYITRAHAGYLVVSALVLAFTDGTPPNLQTCYSNQAYTLGTRDATMSYAPRISGGHVTIYNAS